MTSPCWLQCGWVGLRFLRYKAHPWKALVTAAIALTSSERDRPEAQIAWMRALLRIDLAGVYSLLNDLLW
jgi:hypothetical protein